MDIIAAVVDRSGSMSRIKDDAEGGLNTFLEEQKKVGDARLTLAEFDDEYEVIHNNMDINLFNSYNLSPRGMTALYDAIGRTASSVKDIKTQGKKIFVIVTDGGENSSREWRDKSKVFSIIDEMKNNGWEIMFIGADEESMKEAASLGIDRDSSFQMNTAVKGAAATMYNTVSAYSSSIRSGVNKADAVAELNANIAASNGALKKSNSEDIKKYQKPSNS